MIKKWWNKKTEKQKEDWWEGFSMIVFLIFLIPFSYILYELSFIPFPPGTLGP